ncbi:MAG: OmpA family protein [Crocinitomicaceae bacterium]|nr:OmpA family protein [Crocinitomicaceae bacterium]
MKIFGGLILTVFLVASCVPAKRYNELLEKEQQCSEELAKYKNDALSFEAEAIDLKAKYDLLNTQVSELKNDTTELGQEFRTLRARYDKMAQINEILETNYDKLRLTGARETAMLHAELEAKQIELQKKEDRLTALEAELVAKEHLLAEREIRVQQLERLINEQDAAVKDLKARVAEALRGFENKGLKVEERDGKIYVSLEARLLFASGSIEVQEEGQRALVDLAKVLETEKDLEIIVEGHTDTDQMAGTRHPKNNWELSVLRSTSVIQIMMDNSNIDPTQLMAAGRSEFIPVDDEDKSKNRRIEIIISPNLNELYKLITD